MGEPFFNFSNVISNIKHLAIIYPNSQITITTTGVKPNLIRELANLSLPLVIKIHLSLHSPTDQSRRILMPKVVGLKQSLSALKYFAQKTSTTPKLNYILIRNVNDSPEMAEKLAILVRERPFIVKLSTLNESGNLKSSTNCAVERFENILSQNSIKTCRFTSLGTDIAAGCGQLRQQRDLNES